MSVYRIIFSFLLIPGFLFALPDYPLIRELSFRDPLFLQLGEEISDFYKAEARNERLPELIFFRHTLKEDLDLFSLASRCSLPYDTLASLNGFVRNRTMHKGETLLIPNLPGLFVPRTPRNDMDRFSESISREKGITCSPFGDQEYTFYAGERFGPVERSFFLGVFLGFPLRAGVVSSRYGERIDPFTGHTHFHHGIDLAAPLGSEVLASRAGRVIFSGFDDVYGKYIVLQHTNGYQTLYGHLKNSLVRFESGGSYWV